MTTCGPRPACGRVGDITGHGAFTHMSMYQANIVVADILGEEVSPAEYHAVPRVTFTDPEIGSVGLTEAQARERGLDVRTGCYPVPKSTRGWIHQAGNDGFIKLVADAGRGVLVGATSAGPTGGEVLSMLTLAVHARVPVRRLREMIYAYPTFHRAIESACRSWPLAAERSPSSEAPAPAQPGRAPAPGDEPGIPRGCRPCSSATRRRRLTSWARCASVSPAPSSASCSAVTART